MIGGWFRKSTERNRLYELVVGNAKACEKIQDDEDCDKYMDDGSDIF